MITSGSTLQLLLALGLTDFNKPYSQPITVQYETATILRGDTPHCALQLRPLRHGRH